MQVKATSAALPATSVVPVFVDGEHLREETPALLLLAPAVPLSAVELVMALYGSFGMDADDLAVMPSIEVRHEVATVLAMFGLERVLDETSRFLACPPVEPEDLAFLALCEIRIAEAFGIEVPQVLPAHRAAAAQSGRVLAVAA